MEYNSKVSVMRTIPKENIYGSVLVQMLNRMNFGIGNYFFKLPRGGKVFFFVGHYIHLQGEGILNLSDSINYDMLFGKGRVEILLNENWHIMECNTVVKFSLDDSLKVGNTSYLFGEDNSLRRNIKTYDWNFIINDIYDLVAYQGT
jgi:hypothetical protein